MKPQAETPASPNPAPNAPRSWTTRRDEKARRLASIASWLEDGVLPAGRTTEALE